MAEQLQLQLPLQRSISLAMLVAASTSSPSSSAAIDQAARRHDAGTAMEVELTDKRSQEHGFSATCQRRCRVILPRPRSAQANLPVCLAETMM
jgi:hypothetical protein